MSRGSIGPGAGGVAPGAGPDAGGVAPGAGPDAGAGPDGSVGAIILTGGRASRLGGVDKARLTVAGRPMVETVLRAARAVAGTVVAVGPRGNCREEPPHSGPVAGIAAGLAALRGEVDVVVVVACDLPGLDADTLAALVEALLRARAEASRGAAPAVALGVDASGREQYLLAAWDRRALAARLDRLEAAGGLAGRPVRALFAPGGDGAGGRVDAGEGRTDDVDDDTEFLHVPVGDHAHDVDTWSDLAGRGPVALGHVGSVLAAGLDPVPAQRSTPLGAVGAVLAAPLVAVDAMPRGRVSAMDGYALAGPGPWRLAGDARRAGDDSAASLAPGCAAPIATGALAPDRTDRVLRHELVEVSPAGTEGSAGAGGSAGAVGSVGSAGAGGFAEAGRTASAGTSDGPALVTALAAADGIDDLRPVGEDWPAGFALAPAGTVLDAALSSAALSAGVTEVTVRGPVRATVVITGDEVLPADTPDPLPPGRIRDTVGPLLGTVLARAGFASTGFASSGSDAAPTSLADPRSLEHCPDTAAAVEELLRRRRSSGDVLVLIGATGRGVADHLRPALERAGARIVLDGVRVRPGGSQIVAALPGGGVLLGLPGNPLAAVCAAATTGRALVDALTGHRRTPMLTSVDDLPTHANPQMSRLLPARPDGAGGWILTGRVRTAHLADLAGAPALALVPEAAAASDPIELVDWI